VDKRGLIPRSHGGTIETNNPGAVIPHGPAIGTDQLGVDASSHLLRGALGEDNLDCQGTTGASNGVIVGSQGGTPSRGKTVGELQLATNRRACATTANTANPFTPVGKET
jgi:hypothetical protein